MIGSLLCGWHLSFVVACSTKNSYTQQTFCNTCILTGWAAVALTRLNKTAEAAKLAAGPDGQTPCGYQTLRYLDLEV